VHRAPKEWAFEYPIRSTTRAMITNVPIRVLAIDDHPVLREGLATIVDSQEDMTLVGSAGTGTEAIALFRLHRPDVTLMDLRLPDMHGIEVISALCEEFPQARILVLSNFLGDAYVVGALKAGARGYLMKSALRTDLLGAIRTVHAGGKHLPDVVVSEIANHIGNETLTTREIEVLKLVAMGMSNKSIAVELEISADTTKTHMRSILSKLGANDRTHAVMIGMKRGILDV
jgi:DNA-binding NarL/FixJ family response regulator